MWKLVVRWYPGCNVYKPSLSLVRIASQHNRAPGAPGKKTRMLLKISRLVHEICPKLSRWQKNDALVFFTFAVWILGRKLCRYSISSITPADG